MPHPQVDIALIDIALIDAAAAAPIVATCAVARQPRPTSSRTARRGHPPEIPAVAAWLRDGEVSGREPAA